MLFPQADWLFRKWLGSIFHLRGGKFAHQKVWFSTVFRCVDRTKHSFFLLFSVRQNFIIKKLFTSVSRNIPYYSSWIIFNCSVLYLLKTLSPIYLFFLFFHTNSQKLWLDLMKCDYMNGRQEISFSSVEPLSNHNI